jgi:hypothetical protein
MARIQYQGSARASGYRPQQFDERGLARLREQGDRRLQNMRAVADAEIEDRKRMLQAMKEDEAYTKGAMDRDYRIATGNQQRVAQSLQAQATRDRDQFNIDTKARTAALDSVKAFSDSAKKEADKIYERDRTQAFLDEVRDGMSEESLISKAVQQKLLAENAVFASNARQEAVANGADKVVAAQLRANDDALATDFTEGQIAAYWRWNYADDRTAYLARKAKEKGQALTPEEERRHTGEFRAQVIELMGQQSGFASKLITPYVQQYGDAADTALFAETRRKQETIADERVFAMGLANVANADDASRQRVMQTSWTLMVEAKGYTATLKSFAELFERVDPETGQRIMNPEDLAKFTFPDENGKTVTFAEKFGKTRYLDVIKNLDRAELQWKQDKADAETINRKDWVRNEIALLGESFTQQQVTDLRKKFDAQFPGQTSQEIINLEKRGTIEAKIRVNELDRIFNKQGWEVTERDVEFAKLYGSATQHATVKQKYDDNAGIISNKDVTDIFNKGVAYLTGKNNYSDIAKAGTEQAAVYYERQVRNRTRQLLAQGSTTEGPLVTANKANPTAPLTPEQKLEAAKAAAAQAVREENDKVKAGEDRYKVDRTGPVVRYPEIEKFYGRQNSAAVYDDNINAMTSSIRTKGASQFVNKLENLFTTQRLQQLMQNPSLAPTAYEEATAQELGISQHDLRNLGIKAAGITNYQFADILKTATGVAMTPENVRLVNNMSQTQRRDWLLMNTGGQPRFRAGTIFYRGGNIGPTSTGMHTDIKTLDGSRFDLNELDQFIYVEDRDHGRVSLTALRRLTNNAGDSWDEHAARGSHGIDVGTHTGDGLYLMNGARFLENESFDSEHGYVAVIQLPSGKKFAFRHGTKAKPGQLV